MAYTFKDDGHALTYFREYNKEVGTGDKTLVGNWVEEKALRDVVDSGRYKLWTNPSPDPRAPQATFTKSTTRPDGTDTFRRTVAHNNHTPASEYITSNQVPDPGYCVYTKPQKGARERLLEERAMELAQATAPVPSEDPTLLTSTYRADFLPKDLPLKSSLGRRVMDGEPDFEWRKEAGITAPHQLDDPTAESPSLPMQQSFGRNTQFSIPIELSKSGQEKDC